VFGILYVFLPIRLVYGSLYSGFLRVLNW